MGDDLTCSFCKHPYPREQLFPAGKDEKGELRRICEKCRIKSSQEEIAKTAKEIAGRAEVLTCPACKKQPGVVRGVGEAPLCSSCKSFQEGLAQRADDKARRDGRIKRLPEMIREHIGARYMDCTWDNLDINPDTKAKIRAQVEAGRSLLFLGENGTGKTHATTCIYRDFALADIGPGIEPVFVTASDLMDRVREAIDQGGVRKLIDQFRATKYLLIDDLGMESPTKWTLEQLTRIIDWRYRDGSQTVITTNLTLNEISQAHGDRIRSRIVGLVGRNVVHFKGRDRREDELRGKE